MKTVKSKVEILTDISEGGVKELKLIEAAGRTSYKSEDNITEDISSAKKFVHMIIRLGHESVLEHSLLTVRFTCDRGVSHEIVRHRMAAYTQESTRYCNYASGKFGREITFIEPATLKKDSLEYFEWYQACDEAEKNYIACSQLGLKPEQARAVLPMSVKTEIVMSANYREWRHFLKLRCAKAAHPDIRKLALELLSELQLRIPVVFDDIYEKYKEEM
jgi:thymidylate synthase (FAD)